METWKIQANASGTRSIQVTERHLVTLKRYSLLEGIIDSNGIVDEMVLNKLRLNIRSLLEARQETDRDLLDLALDVVYNSNMKAIGLASLVELYTKEKNNLSEAEDNTAEI